MTQINIQKFNADDFKKREEETDFQGVDVAKWPFTQFSNYVIQNIDEPVAGFIWVYLGSLPPTWEINKEHIKKRFKIGEHTYKKVMSYLKKCNLVYQYQEKMVGGVYGKSRIKVLSGSRFIHPKDHGKNIQPSLNLNVFEDSTGGSKIDLADNSELNNCDSPVVDFPSTGGTASGESTTFIKKIDLKKKTKNKKTTTTEKTSSRSSSLIDISQLHEFGFNEGHKTQLEALNLKANLVNESIGNYVRALEDSAFNDKTRNKPAYFMYVMRTFGFYELPGKRVLTPKQKQARYLIENNVDNRYGI